MRNNLSPGAILIADAISGLPEADREMIREAQNVAEKRQRQWLKQMKKEFALAKKEGRRPAVIPCPPPAFYPFKPRRVITFGG